jgi:hypothetical protein
LKVPIVASAADQVGVGTVQAACLMKLATPTKLPQASTRPRGPPTLVSMQAALEFEASGSSLSAQLNLSWRNRRKGANVVGSSAGRRTVECRSSAPVTPSLASPNAKEFPALRFIRIPNFLAVHHFESSAVNNRSASATDNSFHVFRAIPHPSFPQVALRLRGSPNRHLLLRRISSQLRATPCEIR